MPLPAGLAEIETFSLGRDHLSLRVPARAQPRDLCQLMGSKKHCGDDYST